MTASCHFGDLLELDYSGQGFPTSEPGVGRTVGGKRRLRICAKRASVSMKASALPWMLALGVWSYLQVEVYSIGPTIGGTSELDDPGLGLTNDDEMEIMDGLNKMDDMDEIMKGFERKVAIAKIEQEIAKANRATLTGLANIGALVSDMDGVGDRLEKAILSGSPEDVGSGDISDEMQATPETSADWGWILVSVGLAVLVGLWGTR